MGSVGLEAKQSFAEVRSQAEPGTEDFSILAPSSSLLYPLSSILAPSSSLLHPR